MRRRGRYGHSVLGENSPGALGMHMQVEGSNDPIVEAGHRARRIGQVLLASPYFGGVMCVVYSDVPAVYLNDYGPGTWAAIDLWRSFR